MNMDNYLGTPAPELLGPMRAQATREQDRMARSRGFPSYEAMILWQRQQSRGNKQEVSGAKAAGFPTTWDEAKNAVMQFHPKTVFQNIADIFAGINEEHGK